MSYAGSCVISSVSREPCLTKLLLQKERLRDDAKKAAAADVPETEGDDEDAATKARRKKRIRARKLVKALER